LPNNLLLTGAPGCGKTTVICRVVQRLRDRRLSGFYTDEVRHDGRRVGFRAVGLGGGSVMLAHVDVPGRHRVGRYGVDVKGFEEVVRAEISKPEGEADLFVVDEIGKMECFSNAFVQAATRLLDGPVPLLATVAAKGGGFIGQVKARRDVEILTVSVQNRDGLPDDVVHRLLSSRGISQREIHHQNNSGDASP
jgi:nucleoside-triphosphatase